MEFVSVTLCLVARRFINKSDNPNSREASNEHLALFCDMKLLLLQYPCIACIENNLAQVVEYGRLIAVGETTASGTKFYGVLSSSE